MTQQVPAAMTAADVATTHTKIGGDVVQTVHSLTTAVATGTTVMPFDDTIPQKTEGDEYLTASITPTAVGNHVRVEVILHASADAAGHLVAALFSDSDSDAVAAGAIVVLGSGQVRCVSFTHEFDAAGISPITLHVRMGLSTAGSVTLNGTGGSRVLGGVLKSSLVVTELQAS